MGLGLLGLLLGLLLRLRWRLRGLLLRTRVGDHALRLLARRRLGKLVAARTRGKSTGASMIERIIVPSLVRMTRLIIAIALEPTDSSSERAISVVLQMSRVSKPAALLSSTGIRLTVALLPIPGLLAKLLLPVARLRRLLGLRLRLSLRLGKGRGLLLWGLLWLRLGKRRVGRLLGLVQSHTDVAERMRVLGERLVRMQRRMLLWLGLRLLRGLLRLRRLLSRGLLLGNRRGLRRRLRRRRLDLWLRNGCWLCCNVRHQRGLVLSRDALWLLRRLRKLVRNSEMGWWCSRLVPSCRCRRLGRNRHARRRSMCRGLLCWLRWLGILFRISKLTKAKSTDSTNNLFESTRHYDRLIRLGVPCTRARGSLGRAPL